MQTFGRGKIHTFCKGEEWPGFLGRVELGESFVIETEQFNLVNGPIAVAGVKAGDNIAITVEKIEILPPFTAPNGGPLLEGTGKATPLEYRDGFFHFPSFFRLPARPSVGNIALLPHPSERVLEMARTDPLERGWRATVNDPRAKHCQRLSVSHHWIKDTHEDAGGNRGCVR